MQDRQLANNCCFSNLNQSTPYPSNLTSFLSGINQVGSFKLLGLIASASSFGVTTVWHQAAQAETNFYKDSSETGETFISELDINKSDTNKTIANKNNTSTAIVENQNSDNSDLDHRLSNRDQSLPIPQPNFSFNLQQNSFNIPQLPSLAVNTLQQEKAADNLYTVRAGDTIVGIARKHGISSRQIIKANRLVNPNFIKVNRQLIIPSQEFTKGFARSVAFKNRKYSLSNNFIKPEPSKKTYLNFSKNPKSDDRSAPLAEIDTKVQKRTVVSKNKDPYISKLRQDIVKLRSEYQQQLRGNRIDASQATSFKNPKTLTAINRVNLNQPQSKAPTRDSVKVNHSQEKISNTLATTIKDFALAPKLPPLASPEEYLPENPISKGYMWPAQGNLTSGYGWRWGRLHKGIDIAAPIGTPIVAAASGEVIFAGWNTGGYGNLVKLKHNDGSVTLYAHNNRVLIRSGQQVKQGQLIAEMGSTGRSSGPHLHFEIRPNGSSAINPIARLPKK